MKLHGELPARTVLGLRPRAHHHRFIHPVLVHLGTPERLNSSPAGIAGSAVGRVPELLVTEQTHPDHVRPARPAGG